MQEHRTDSSSSWVGMGGRSSSTRGERTESFMLRLEELNKDCAAAEVAIKALSGDINAYVQRKEDEEREWLANEALWLAELKALKEAGTSSDAEAEEADLVAAEQQYWTSSREWRDIIYTGCYFHDVNDAAVASSSAPPAGKRSSGPSSFNSIEAILEQKHFKNRLYYKVKWAGADVVSWEEAHDLKMIGALKGPCMTMLAPQRRTARLRPAEYCPNRVMAARKGNAAAAGAGERAFPGLWSCEVERDVWIPYDSYVQQTIEKAFMSRNESVKIDIGGRGGYEINFARMQQQGGTVRRVKRTEQIPDDVIRTRIHTMSLNELREYLSTVVEFGPVHYEALSRLHEEDKVVTHLSQHEMAALPSARYSDLVRECSSPAGSSCSVVDCGICLEDYCGEDVLVCMPNCGHYFHKACAGNYFSKFSKLCPFCKESVV